MAIRIGERIHESYELPPQVEHLQVRGIRILKPVELKLEIPIRVCQREGWDCDREHGEKCGAHYREQSCKCHSTFCPYCCIEIHGFSLNLPPVMQNSPLENYCSAKGNS